MIKKRLTRNKIYFSLIAFLFALMIVSGILSPLLLEKEKNEWDKILIDKTDFFENAINSTFDRKSDLLATTGSEIKKKLHGLISSTPLDQKKIMRLITNPELMNVSLHLYDS